MMIKSTSLLVVFCLFFSAGCGYVTSGFNYKESEIFIKPIANEINIVSEGRKYSGYNSFPRLLEKRLTSVVVEKFNNDGHLRPVSVSGEEALELYCSIKKYDKNTLRYADNDEVKEQRLTLEVEARLMSFAGEVLKQRIIVGESSFFLSGPRRKSEEAAQTDLIDDTAKRIVEMVIEEW